MKLHYERVWDAEFSDETIWQYVKEYCQQTFPTYSAIRGLLELNKKHIHKIAAQLIETVYPDEKVPNAFVAPLRKYIKQAVDSKIDELAKDL